MNKIILFKIETGETKLIESGEAGICWYAEGNGCCDCNRAINFGDDNYEDCSHDKYLIIDWELTEEDKKEYNPDIYYMNKYYAKELVDKYIKAKGVLNV